MPDDKQRRDLQQALYASSIGWMFPIAIGGGHNNAYPLIKGSAKGLYKAGRIPLAQINCINLDAHTDFRPSEGRHSGNGFRYAEEDGYLQKYCAVGVHENYLPQNVWLDIVNNPFIDFITYEDIFLHEKKDFIQAVAHAAGFGEDVAVHSVVLVARVAVVVPEVVVTRMDGGERMAVRIV